MSKLGTAIAIEGAADRLRVFLPAGVADAKGLPEHYRRVRERLGIRAGEPRPMQQVPEEPQEARAAEAAPPEVPRPIEFDPSPRLPADATVQDRVAHALIRIEQLTAERPYASKIHFIRIAVASSFNVRLDDLVSPRRYQSIAKPRMIAMAMARHLTRESLPEIGRWFGNRDHTTVLHAWRKYGALVSSVVGQDAAAGACDRISA